MSRKDQIWLKSAGIGVALGLAAWSTFYLFFLCHRELGVRPASAFWLGIVGFAAGTVSALLYFAMKTER
ncbi:MAG TPA: hypothetical protein VLT16_11670 [Candidatus Limnocylindrales bacterium]|nr:hypothetical protein [Candidatus Limnocylindrales bacterium]